MHDESTSNQDGRAQEYAAMIKPGDAVETPDGSLWVVDGDRENDVVTTIVPAAHVTKIADARQVRRS